jgi:hypothetical protein
MLMAVDRLIGNHPLALSPDFGQTQQWCQAFPFPVRIKLLGPNRELTLGAAIYEAPSPGTDIGGV